MEKRLFQDLRIFIKITPNSGSLHSLLSNELPEGEGAPFIVNNSLKNSKYSHDLSNCYCAATV